MRHSVIFNTMDIKLLREVVRDSLHAFDTIGDKLGCTSSIQRSDLKPNVEFYEESQKEFYEPKAG